MSDLAGVQVDYPDIIRTGEVFLVEEEAGRYTDDVGRRGEQQLQQSGGEIN